MSILLAVWAALALGQQPDAVVHRLSQTSMFAFGGVGFALTIAQGEKDYRLILSRPSAKADFARVYAEGTPQAKAYALTGFAGLTQRTSNCFRSG